MTNLNNQLRSLSKINNSHFIIVYNINVNNLNINIWNSWKISNTWNIFTDTNIIAPNLNFF